MQQSQCPAEPTDGVVLLQADGSSWRAVDQSFPLSDARSLLAYIERSGDRYMVLSLVPPVGGVTETETLAEAEEIARRLRTGIPTDIATDHELDATAA